MGAHRRNAAAPTGAPTVSKKTFAIAAAVVLLLTTSIASAEDVKRATPANQDKQASGPEHPTTGTLQVQAMTGITNAGLGVGAGVLAAAMGARGNALEAEFDDPANACVLATPSRPCQDILDRGRSANAVAIAGVVGGTLLIGGGVALLVTGLRRRSAAPPTQTIAPALGPGFVGLTARRSF